MRWEKINDQQLRCFITPADLKAHELTAGDLKYGSKATRALFDEVMETAVDRYQFNEEHLPVIIEAVPLRTGELMVILSAVENAEEMDPHFAHFQETAEEETAEEKSGKAFPETEEAEPVSVFRFEDMGDVIDFCRIISKLPISTTLYQTGKAHTYYVTAEKLKSADLRDFLAIRNRLEEIREPEARSRDTFAWLQEHGKVVLPEPHLFLSGQA